MDVTSGPQLLYRNSGEQEPTIPRGSASERPIPREVHRSGIGCTFDAPSWCMCACCRQAEPPNVRLVLG